ncbi:alkaline phosphatase [Arcticibacter pallidicorallinus]|uniref:Alkaline phosphatase n=1 Tax=Arcticibacter pallidicorallinus TaxID=1259464 RepID=A0A2T0TXF0_9SPHI|nr:alkaline phosphatase [Arcticibacter pallidicorallinus]PRY50355.1 alkaline phosphatase [Arcticibacter pallidicorallinus]
MKRRDFFKNTSLTALGAAFLSPAELFAFNRTRETAGSGKIAKNIIFLVSDGMSMGTLTLANLLLQRKEGRKSKWIEMYEQNRVSRALMDTASADALVTDSAAASSSWGGGVRVNNGSLNVGPQGQQYKPILQKFKSAGKSVGCVTTVPITHATPAGFSINSDKRSAQEDIALQYLSLRFDVMLGGGLEYFSAHKRKDKKDLLANYRQSGFSVLRDRSQLADGLGWGKRPVIGVFHEDGLPYSLDREQDPALVASIPTLAEMTTQAINHLSKNKKGFVMQVEAGKVDWAAHANDAAALIYDQIAFDDAVKAAIDFAEKDGETLVIITTDHGNANPGLFGADSNFDKLHHFKQTNDWLLKGIDRSFSASKIIERMEAAQGIVITKDEAASLLKPYETMDSDSLYNPYKLPFKELADIQSKYTSIGWGGMNHSADHVELAMFGPGSERLKPFVKNTELHNFMLEVAGIDPKKTV